MKAKTIFFCLFVIVIFVAVFFFCAAAKTEERQTKFFFKQGKEEIVFGGRNPHIKFEVGGSAIETIINGKDTIGISYGMEFCELSEKENDLDKIEDPSQYKYEDKVAYYRDLYNKWSADANWTYWEQYGVKPPKTAESAERDETIKKRLERIKRSPRFIHLKIGKIILIKVGNRYAAIKPVKFVLYYNSIDEVPLSDKSAFVYKISKSGSSYGVRTNNIRDLPNSRHEYEEIKDENGGIILQKKFEYIKTTLSNYKSIVYEWKYWPNVVPENERAREETGVKTLTVSPSKNSYVAGISFSWKILSNSQPEKLRLNYEVKLSSIKKLELALVKGIGLADIKDPGLHSFNEVGQRSGEIPVGLNEIIIFRVDNDKCFALMPVRVEDNGIIKGVASGEVINKSIVYEQRNWSMAETALNK